MLPKPAHLGPRLTGLTSSEIYKISLSATEILYLEGFRSRLIEVGVSIVLAHGGGPKFAWRGGGDCLVCSHCLPAVPQEVPRTMVGMTRQVFVR